jgi:AcrR family transcriptional regulator
MIMDHRTQPRGAGRRFQEAILDAARAELAEVGYANLTMERVAARAKASKASVYSRWPSMIEHGDGRLLRLDARSGRTTGHRHLAG